MAFRIRSIDQTATGREIVREREVAGDSLSIGRSAENDVQIADLAVEQHHVTVEPAPGGKLALKIAGSLHFTLDGRSATAAEIDPGEGAELVLGSCRLSFAREPDGVVGLTVRQVETHPAAGGEAARGFSLAGVLPGKRAMSWAALLTILVAFLAVPVWSSLTRDKVEPDIDRPGAVLMDASWSTGALSSAHHKLEGQCEACHVEPFVAVRDSTCLACHEDISDHAAPARLTPARGPLDWGDRVQWNVAHAFNKPGPGACTDCHTEHEGSGRMRPAPQQFCSDCHASLDQRLTSTALGNAADFGKAHPTFQPLVITSPTEDRAQRMTLASHPRQWGGLRFPHALHLDPRGGVSRMAQRLGEGAALECSDCHKPTADGVRFGPVNMQRDCESCHSLVFEQAGSGFRSLDHGNIARMRAQFAALDARGRPAIVSDRRRPGAVRGEYGEGGLYAARFTPPSMAGSALSRAMADGGLCAECHYPSGRAPLGVLPVHQPDRYLVHGWFDHTAHRELELPDGRTLTGTAACESCHKASNSRSAADLLLPDLAQCRTCHLGEDARKPMVPSSCAMCHSYHPRSGDAAGPPRIARK